MYMHVHVHYIVLLQIIKMYIHVHVHVCQGFFDNYHKIYVDGTNLVHLFINFSGGGEVLSQ